MTSSTNTNIPTAAQIPGHESCPICASQSKSGSDTAGRSVYTFDGKASFQKTIAAILSHPAESIDRKLLNNVVKAAALPGTPPLNQETTQKIELIKKSILLPAAEAELELRVKNAINQYRSFNSPFPSSHKLTSLLLESLMDFYAGNDHLLTLEKFLQKADALSKPVFEQEGLKYQMSPQFILHELIKKTIDPIFEDATPSLSQPTSTFPSKVRMAQRLIRSLATSSTKYKDTLQQELDQRLTAACNSLRTLFNKASPAKSGKIMRNIFALSELIKEFRSTATLSQALTSEADELASLLVQRFLFVFKNTHSKLIKQNTSSNMAYLRQLMEQIVSLQEALKGEEMHSSLDKFENTLAAVINETFTPAVLADIAHSETLDKTTKNLASSIRELTIFLDSKSKTLHSFVVCFDKIYVNLFGIRDTLVNPDPNNLVNKTLTGILRGFVQKAIQAFGDTGSACSIDLSDPQICKLKKRLDILMAVVPRLLQSHIQVKLSMNVKQDTLLATLYQLHAAAYSDGHKTWHRIKEWISAHQEHDIEGFADWLRDKIVQNSPLLIDEDDCETTYLQYLSEAANAG